MFDALQDLVAEITSGNKHPSGFDDHDNRLAAAALLVHAATIDGDGRKRLIEMLWQIAFADGRVTEFEDNLNWRAADLLGITSRDRIALRQRVAGQLKAGACRSGA